MYFYVRPQLSLNEDTRPEVGEKYFGENFMRRQNLGGKFRKFPILGCRRGGDCYIADKIFAAELVSPKYHRCILQKSCKIPLTENCCKNLAKLHSLKNVGRMTAVVNVVKILACVEMQFALDNFGGKIFSLDILAESYCTFQ